MSRRKLILAGVVLLIAVNGLLISIDDEGKVPRLSYIESWSETFEKDMYETLETAGVLAATEEKNVYFDQEQGRFQEFLVEEGTSVSVGDQLFTYQVDDYNQTMVELEGRQQELTGEIQAIETAITTISAYQVPETDMDTTFEDDNSTLEMTSRSVETTYMKEQYLTEKETELAKKEAELQSVQAQIAELETTGETITVESPYEGQVTGVSESLTNPAVTIRNLELQAEGELTESERMAVEPDMPAEVDIRKNDVVLQGALSEISDTPETTSVHGSSVYSFAASLEEGEPDGPPTDAEAESDGPEADETEPPGDTIEIEEEDRPSEDESAATDTEQSAMDDLLPGYHADVTITTEESAGATAVRQDHLFNSHLWKMTPAGLLVKEQVDTGINMDDLVEITDGAEPGEVIADSDVNQFRNQTAFITPLKLKDIEWKDPGKYDNVNWTRYFVTGLLSR